LRIVPILDGLITLPTKLLANRINEAIAYIRIRLYHIPKHGQG
jgi:hypothetical protein